ncbi:MAG: rhodanese-like domain-containing protein [Chitinophagaceae bacterium]
MKLLSGQDYLKSEALSIDIRSKESFMDGYIKGSIYIGNDIALIKKYIKDLFIRNKNIIFITDETSISILQDIKEALLYDREIEYIDYAIVEELLYTKYGDMVIPIEADELLMDMNFDKNLIVIDCQSNIEFEQKHIQSAINIPLSELLDSSLFYQIEDKHNVYVYCDNEYRALVATTIFKQKGIHNIHFVENTLEEIAAIKNMPVVEKKESLN